MANAPSIVNPSKSGQEWLDVIANHPTLDELLNRSPIAIPYSDEELTRIIEIERAQRALFNIKEQAKRDKKAGVEPEPTGDDTNDDAAE